MVDMNEADDIIFYSARLEDALNGKKDVEDIVDWCFYPMDSDDEPQDVFETGCRLALLAAKRGHKIFLANYNDDCGRAYIIASDEDAAVELAETLEDESSDKDEESSDDDDGEEHF